ncbi:MAG: NUDIX domain-containing protein [Bacteroidales bacterium]|nr:NUDIX domain-containing protein [Bacteroidales bacterium]MBN2821109.1 NUDIX domain-containing protein [Bacteroidales bacterium]
MVLFKSCPKCGEERITFDGIKKYSCENCDWTFFQNTAAAVAGIITFQDKVLAVRRNRDPGKGLLDFPGGFVDPNESLEQALYREINEELRAEINNITYLCSSPNTYKYKGITYSTCDSFFTAEIDNDNFELEKSEIAEVVFLDKNELNPDLFAFKSMRAGIEAFRKNF